MPIQARTNRSKFGGDILAFHFFNSLLSRHPCQPSDCGMAWLRAHRRRLLRRSSHFDEARLMMQPATAWGLMASLASIVKLRVRYREKNPSVDVEERSCLVKRRCRKKIRKKNRYEKCGVLRSTVIRNSKWKWTHLPKSKEDGPGEKRTVVEITYVFEHFQ